MVDGMEVSGAARAPPNPSLVAPTDPYSDSTATLGTRTARTGLVDRRVSTVPMSISPLTPTTQLVTILLLPCLSWACAFPTPLRTIFPPPTHPPLSPRCAPLPLLSTSRRLRRSQPHPPPLLQVHGACSRDLSSSPSSFLQYLPLSVRSLPPGPTLRGLATPPYYNLGCPSFDTQQRSPFRLRRKAMAPAYPDARKGSCQNGLSLICSHPMLANCPSSVIHMSTCRSHTASQMCFTLNTCAPFLTDQPCAQPPHRARPSQVRASEHHHAGGHALQRPQRGTQAAGAYYRAWCAPINQSPNPITS